jgi:AAA+ ATPase superfamily predicted ATPase
MKESVGRHYTVVFDEFQNFYKVNPAIFSEMQDIWDRYHRESHINLIAMGSIRSLMKRIFEDKNEPLYGRPTSKFTLLPFTISVLKQIFGDYQPNYKNEDLLCLYMITGGVAKYVELLMDAGCYTKEKMLNYVCRQDSYFLSEGRDIVNQEFGDESNTYFSILQLIAGGMTRRSEIDGAMQKDMGTFIQNLDSNYNIITRLKPLLAKPNSKTSVYEITDQFLRFWFRFVWPYQALVERQQLSLLRQNMGKGYEQFTGRTLEQYFQQKAMESGLYTMVGNWWDRKGENEIDMIALNEFDHTGVAAEIKRNPKKLSLSELETKVKVLPVSDFTPYVLKLQTLSIEDM